MVRAIPLLHDDVIKRKPFPRYWTFVRGIHRSPVNSPHKGQWHGALMFLWSAPWINGWVNNREAGDLRRHRAHYDVNVMLLQFTETEPCNLIIQTRKTSVFKAMTTMYLALCTSVFYVIGVGTQTLQAQFSRYARTQRVWYSNMGWGMKLPILIITYVD